MYRFQTKRCYQCKPLTELYHAIDTKQSGLDQMCTDQLMNHQTANLLSTEWDEAAADEESSSEDLMVAQAVDNMKNFFTLIGLTEQLTDTVDMVGHVFPWMNATIAGSDQVCALPHVSQKQSLRTRLYALGFAGASG
jgi:hypothetical protein